MDKQLRNIIETYYSGYYEENEDCLQYNSIFDLSRTGIPLYDNILKKGNEYLKEKTRITYELKCISPEAYIKKCAMIYNTDYNREIKMISKIRLYNLKKAVDNGEKLYLPVIDFASKFQKGKYRVLVADEKLIKKIPVMIVKINI